MLQSSAYRTNRWPRRSSSRSNSSSTRFESSGESTPPTILQNSAGGVRRVRAGWGMDWLDAKDDVHVLPVDFNPLRAYPSREMALGSPSTWDGERVCTETNEAARSG